MIDRAYATAINPEYDGCQRGLASMIYKLFDKKIGWGVSVNEKLTQEFQKPVITKTLKKENLYWV